MIKRRKTAPFKFEKDLRGKGYRHIGGMDEAGRGPLAGPVCAAIVIFEDGVRITGVYDSKELEPEEREDLYHIILDKALAVGIGLACAEEIDHLNILRATKLAARRALRSLSIMPDYLLLDALTLDKVTVPQLPLTKGDARSFSIAAASIIAKVTRDRLMIQCSEEFPGYAFEKHKGYGTTTHRRSISELGPCSLHRQTFLESWFGTESLRYSRLHTTVCKRLQECSHSDHIHHVLTELKIHSDWLPVTEWNDLTDKANQRKSQLGPVI